MNRAIILATCLLVAGPAASQSVSEKTGVNSALGIAPKTEDFVKELAISDMFEIDSSQLAVERSDGPAKQFATRMMADHRKTTADLKEMIATGKVKAAPPSEMDDAHKKKLTALQGLKGGDFTKQYVSDQVSAHKDAVDLFKRYANGGDNADLKAWAAKMVPTLEDHLKMAQQLAG